MVLLRYESSIPLQNHWAVGFIILPFGIILLAGSLMLLHLYEHTSDADSDMQTALIILDFND